MFFPVQKEKRKNLLDKIKICDTITVTIIVIVNDL